MKSSGIGPHIAKCAMGVDSRPTGNQPSATEKNMIASRHCQKVGMAYMTMLTSVLAVSKALPRFQPAITPSTMPMTVARSVPRPQRMIVGQMRSATIWVTGTLKANE